MIISSVGSVESVSEMTVPSTLSICEAVSTCHCTEGQTAFLTHLNLGYISKYILHLFPQVNYFGGKYRGQIETDGKGQSLVAAKYYKTHCSCMRPCKRNVTLNAGYCHLNSIVIADLSGIWF